MDLERVFEGTEALDALLREAGSTATAQDVIAMMALAQEDGAAPGDVIPGLFEGEPHFAKPGLARQLYGNLLGLWDVLLQGPMPTATPRPAPPVKVEAPAPFGTAGPDTAFVEAAWRYLEANEKERERAWHAFENRQDTLLAALDEAGLSDAADAVARYVLFELNAMIELGRGARTRQVRAVDLRHEPPPGRIPPSLDAYLEEAIFEAEQEQEEGDPLPPEEAKGVRQVARAGLLALWSAGSEQ